MIAVGRETGRQRPPGLQFTASQSAWETALALGLQGYRVTMKREGAGEKKWVGILVMDVRTQPSTNERTRPRLEHLGTEAVDITHLAQGTGDPTPQIKARIPPHRHTHAHGICRSYPHLDEATLFTLQGAEALAQEAVTFAQPSTFSLQLRGPGQQPGQLVSQCIQQLGGTIQPRLCLVLTQCPKYGGLDALQAGEAVSEVRAARVDEETEVGTVSPLHGDQGTVGPGSPRADDGWRRCAWCMGMVQEENGAGDSHRQQHRKGQEHRAQDVTAACSLWVSPGHRQGQTDGQEKRRQGLDASLCPGRLRRLKGQETPLKESCTQPSQRDRGRESKEAGVGEGQREHSFLTPAPSHLSTLLSS